MSSKYTYTHLQDDLVFNLSLAPKGNYVGSLYPPLHDLLIARHNANPEYKNRITNPEQRLYSNYLQWISQVNKYPALYSAQLSVSPASNYFDELSSRFDSQKTFTFDTVFPIAVRYTDNKNVWLIERPPFLANITFKNARSSSMGNDKTYSIWMPWTVMLLVMIPEQSFYNAYLFFNDSPLTSLDEPAVPCMFPNIYADGRMCLNQTSIMLQQHLSEVNAFDPSTIYNFIINDYMTGGWNTDLGINFDRIVNYSTQAAKARRTIVNGKSLDKKKYPSATTPSGRLSSKKYIPNFLNYFSQAPLEEITSIVSQMKAKVLESNNNFYSSYQTFINKALSEVSSSNPYTVPFISTENSPSVYISHDIYIDPAIIETLKTAESFTDSSMISHEESFCATIFNHLRDMHSSDISSLQLDSRHNSYNNSPNPLYLDAEESSYKLWTLNPNIEDQKFLELKFPLTNSEVQNV